ncbi:MAG: T9SS type A sorting domain-containing protein [Flavobacteriales bacterium]|jgi:hypothetical protein|nr:T9SS type A sorting domain-containing protein [Flavobacteriales bacterium]MCB0759340.1 T9SS type A sorting domain-containing protein [Flavobacteriales bacterium]
MKRSLLFTLLGTFTGLVSAQTVLVNEDFDSYAAGDLVAQTIGLPWSTWSVAPGGTEDTPISNEQASSGTQSMKVTGVAAGGPTDLVLRLGNRSTGSYILSWNMYVPSGNGGYFNIQRNEVPGAGSFMLEVTFKVDGTIEYMNNTVASAGSYPHDTWFSVAMAFDLGTSVAALSIDGTAQYSWQTNTPGPNQIGGIDFFAYAGGTPNVPLYYVDDVLFIDLGTVGIEENAPAEVAVYPNPATDMLTVELPHGTTAIASLVDITGRTVIDGIAFGSRTQFPLNGLSKGLYFVRVRQNGKEIVRRVTVE